MYSQSNVAFFHLLSPCIFLITFYSRVWKTMYASKYISISFCYRFGLLTNPKGKTQLYLKIRTFPPFTFHSFCIQPCQWGFIFWDYYSTTSQPTDLLMLKRKLCQLDKKNSPPFLCEKQNNAKLQMEIGVISTHMYISGWNDGINHSQI